MSGAVPQFPSSPNYAMEKMKEIDERTRLENMHTKQKAGTPTVILELRKDNHLLRSFILSLFSYNDKI